MDIHFLGALCALARDSSTRMSEALKIKVLCAAIQGGQNLLVFETAHQGAERRGGLGMKRSQLEKELLKAGVIGFYGGRPKAAAPGFRDWY